MSRVKELRVRIFNLDFFQREIPKDNSPKEYNFHSEYRNLNNHQNDQSSSGYFQKQNEREHNYQRDFNYKNEIENMPMKSKTLKNDLKSSTYNERKDYGVEENENYYHDYQKNFYTHSFNQ